MSAGGDRMAVLETRVSSMDQTVSALSEAVAAMQRKLEIASHVAVQVRTLLKEEKEMGDARLGWRSRDSVSSQLTAATRIRRVASQPRDRPRNRQPTDASSCGSRGSADLAGKQHKGGDTPPPSVPDITPVRLQMSASTGLLPKSPRRMPTRDASARTDSTGEFLEGLMDEEGRKRNPLSPRSGRIVTAGSVVTARMLQSHRQERQHSDAAAAAAQSPTDVDQPRLVVVDEADGGPVRNGRTRRRTRNSVVILRDEDHSAAHGGVLMPDALARRCLHAVLTTAVLADTIDISLSAVSKGWHNDDYDLTPAFPIAWGVVECLLFGVELYLNTKTAILDDWELLDSDPREIWMKYKSTWFAFDFVVWLPIEMAAYAADFLAYRIARSLKALRVFRVPFLFPLSSPLEEGSKAVEAFLFFFYCSLGVIWMTVVWMRLATADELRGNLPEPDSLDEITYAVYFIVTTLSSVGYGDLSPTRPGTQWYSIFVQLVGVGWLIYVGAVGTAFILEDDPFRVSVKDRKRRLAALMKNNNIPWQLQKQCFTILPSVLESSIKDYSVILGELPPFMQDKIRDCLKAQLVQSVPLFRGADNEVLQAVVRSLRSAIIPPREYIIEIGEIGEEMFFISHGCVEVTVPGSDGEERWVATLKDGSWFGEVALLCSTERTANVRAISACDVFVLQKAHFLSIVEAFPSFELTIRAEFERRMAGRMVTPQLALSPAESPGPAAGPEDSRMLRARSRLASVISRGGREVMSRLSSRRLHPRDDAAVPRSGTTCVESFEDMCMPDEDMLAYSGNRQLQAETTASLSPSPTDPGPTDEQGESQSGSDGIAELPLATPG